MKVYINNPNEGWVVDRFRKEFCQRNPEIITENIFEADLVWIIAPWTWRQLPSSVLRDKKVVCTIHHIVPEKFDNNKHTEFYERDKFVDYYHVPSVRTLEQVNGLIKGKHIWTLPFWVNDELWFEIQEKSSLREKYGISKDVNLIGSFQRDTEGHDLKTPKLEKGPDIFCNVVESIHKKNANTEVLLAGWRRQYVMGRLDEAGIKYHYFELPSFEVINELYNCLDLYVVGSRHEGGPQAIFECATTKTPIISTDVGAANIILSEKSIFTPGNLDNVESDTIYASNKVEKYFISNGINEFINKFKTLI
jgi:glycosyltransferase involved in cell wall biosynthesis